MGELRSPIPNGSCDGVQFAWGVPMIGGIATPKGLRIAIKRVFGEQAEEILSRKPKTLTLWEINQILHNHMTTHDGRIPLAKPCKTTQNSSISLTAA
jgi:hypothetical protein